MLLAVVTSIYEFIIEDEGTYIWWRTFDDLTLNIWSKQVNANSKNCTPYVFVGCNAFEICEYLIFVFLLMPYILEFYTRNLTKSDTSSENARIVVSTNKPVKIVLYTRTIKSRKFRNRNGNSRCIRNLVTNESLYYIYLYFFAYCNTFCILHPTTNIKCNYGHQEGNQHQFKEQGSICSF